LTWPSNVWPGQTEKHLRAGEGIFIVDDSKCEPINPSKIRRVKEIDRDDLYNRLGALSSQDYGFAIHLSKGWIDKFGEKLREGEKEKKLGK